MKIVIVGIGKVGETLSAQLATEGHDIVVIDSNPKIYETINTVDINCVIGNGAGADVMIEAGVPTCDLLLAVTSMDEVNMLVCLMGKKLGAKHTIARVRNPEYSSQLYLLKDELGLSMSINPEFAAAEEISRLLRFPSAMTVDTFAKGKAETVELKLKEGSPLAGIPISSIIKKYPCNILICAIERNGEIIIPSGDVVLEPNDTISIAATPREIERFFKKTGILMKRTIKNVMIIGGSRISMYLARQLCDMGLSVTIIESDKKKCRALSEALPKATIIFGDGTDHKLLFEEGLLSTDAFVTLTGIDEENIIMSMYAKSKGIGKIITKVNKSCFLDMLSNSEIETFVSPKLTTAIQILQYVRAMQNSVGSGILTLHSIVDGRVEALEFGVKPTSKCIGIPLKDMVLKDNLLIACIVRNGKTIIPSGNDTIEANDNCIVVTSCHKLYEFDDIRKNSN